MNDSVIFSLIDVANSAPIAEQGFAVTGEMVEYSMDLKGGALLSIREANDNWAKLLLPAIPGESLLVYQDNTQETHLGGSQFYVDYDQAEQTVRPILNQLTENMKHQSGEYASMSKEEAEYYGKQYCALIEELNEVVLNYVKSHPDQDAAAALLFVLSDDDKIIEQGEALLTERARNSTVANLYKAFRTLFKK